MKDRKLKQVLCAAYGGGQIKQAQIAGEYPPPPVDMPENEGTARADADIRVSGTVTGRWTRDKPPFHELYGGKPTKLGEVRRVTQDEIELAKVDYAELEKRVLAWMGKK